MQFSSTFLLFADVLAEVLARFLFGEVPTSFLFGVVPTSFLFGVDPTRWSTNRNLFLGEFGRDFLRIESLLIYVFLDHGLEVFGVWHNSSSLLSDFRF